MPPGSIPISSAAGSENQIVPSAATASPTAALPDVMEVNDTAPVTVIRPIAPERLANTSAPVASGRMYCGWMPFGNDPDQVYVE